MKVRIAGLTAVLALAFAAPAEAHFLDKGPLGGGDNGMVSCNEATYVTAAHMGSYHGGGYLRSNCIGTSANGSETLLGVRARDGALLYSWVRMQGGQYYLFMQHQ